MNSVQIPMWFYIIMAIATSVGVLVGIWFSVSKKIKEDAEWKGRMDEYKGNTGSVLVEIKDDLKSIREFLFGGHKLIDADGPVQLPHLGREVSRELGANEWAEKLAPKLLDRITNFSKEFEIYDFCRQYVRNEFKPSKELETLMQEVAYNHGMDAAGVVSVYPIELRDALLKLQSTV